MGWSLMSLLSSVFLLVSAQSLLLELPQLKNITVRGSLGAEFRGSGHLAFHSSSLCGIHSVVVCLGFFWWDCVELSGSFTY